MTTLTKIQGVVIYIYAVIYGITSIAALFSSISSSDGSLFLLTLLFTPISYLLYLFGKAHFRLARRAENYIKFCKAHKLNDDKEHTEKFYSMYFKKHEIVKEGR